MAKKKSDNRAGSSAEDLQLLNFLPQRLNNVLAAEKVNDSIYCFRGFGNVSAVLTNEGLVLVDTGNANLAERVKPELRKLSDKPVRYIIHTHGHLDHSGQSARAFLEQGTEIVAHENVKARFDRYREQASWQARINAWLYRGELIPRGQVVLDERTIDPAYPTITYRDEYSFALGRLTFQLFHAKGETDDHTVVWVPEERAAFTGDLLIAGFPNIGNPLKVLRYEKEWYEALEKILALEPSIVVPGHGAPLLGREAIREVLEPNIEVLRFLHEQVVWHLNRGSTLEQMLAEIELPQHLAENPHLRTFHGCREFTIRGIYRRYGGWLEDMNATSLFPAPKQEVAGLIAEMCGGSEKMLAKASELMEQGRCQLGLHLVDMVIDADRRNRRAHLLKAAMLEKIPENNPLLPIFLARNVYLGQAARERKLAESD